MSEEQNDSPAFRLRPRRSAPKSYYAVRLEYSANPEAFIRERPRAKRKAFTQKSGSNSTRVTSKVGTATSQKPNVITKEEREREEKRLLLHRGISESLTTNTLISPFMQRLELGELEPDSLYEHNYITLKIKQVEQSHSRRLLSCFCTTIDESSSICAVTVKLHNEYADAEVVKEGKILNVSKFRTGPRLEHEDNANFETIQQSQSTNSHNSINSSSRKSSVSSAIHHQGNDTGHQHKVSPTTSIKTEPNDSKSSPRCSLNASKEQDYSEGKCKTVGSSDVGDTNQIQLLPFHVLVKYDELVERSTSNSNKGASSTITRSTSPAVSASVNRRPVLPFVSVSDMIEQPIEPYVEMCPESPRSSIETDKIDDENQESKKVKFTASV